MISISKPIRAQRDNRNAPPAPGKPLRDLLWLLLLLLLLPALFAFDWPPGHIVLYSFAAIFWVLVLASLRKGPEVPLAVTITCTCRCAGCTSPGSRWGSTGPTSWNYA